MINLPNQAVTGFKRKAKDTLVTMDKEALFVRIELRIHYYLEVEGQDVEVKRTHHALTAVNSVLVDPQTLDLATEETQNPVGEYDAYQMLIDSGAIPIPAFIEQAILIADSRGRFN